MVSLITTVLNPPILGEDEDEVFSNKTDVMFGTDLPAMAAEMNTLALTLADDVAGANYSTNSTTSASLTTGSKPFATEAGKMFQAGQDVVIASGTSPITNRMWGTISAYDFATGAMTVTVDLIAPGASGTHTDWFISLTGARGPAGTASPWTQIQSTSASGSSVSFTSIPSTYNNLMLAFTGLSIAAVTNTLNMAFSPDGSSWSSSLALKSISSASATYDGEFIFFDYNADHGLVIGAINATAASPALTATETTIPVHWNCTGGIDAVRLTLSGSTFDAGTVILKGN